MRTKEEFYMREAHVRTIEQEARRANNKAAFAREDWIGDILESADLPRTIALEEAVFLLSKRSVKLSVPDDHELISTEKLKIMRAQAEAYKAMCEASKAYVDPQTFTDACNTFYDANDDDGTFCVPVYASANKTDLNEIPLVQFIWADYGFRE